jgi:hypothetical protein
MPKNNTPDVPFEAQDDLNQPEVSATAQPAPAPEIPSTPEPEMEPWTPPENPEDAIWDSSAPSDFLHSFAQDYAKSPIHMPSYRLESLIEHPNASSDTIQHLYNEKKAGNEKFKEISGHRFASAKNAPASIVQDFLESHKTSEDDDYSDLEDVLNHPSVTPEMAHEALRSNLRNKNTRTALSSDKFQPKDMLAIIKEHEAANPEDHATRWKLDKYKERLIDSKHHDIDSLKATKEMLLNPEKEHTSSGDVLEDMYHESMGNVRRLATNPLWQHRDLEDMYDHVGSDSDILNHPNIDPSFVAAKALNPSSPEEAYAAISSSRLPHEVQKRLIDATPPDTESYDPETYETSTASKLLDNESLSPELVSAVYHKGAKSLKDRVIKHPNVSDDILEHYHQTGAEDPKNDRHFLENAKRVPKSILLNIAKNGKPADVVRALKRQGVDQEVLAVAKKRRAADIQTAVRDHPLYDKNEIKADVIAGKVTPAEYIADHDKSMSDEEKTKLHPMYADRIASKPLKNLDDIETAIHYHSSPFVSDETKATIANKIIDNTVQSYRDMDWDKRRKCLSAVMDIANNGDARAQDEFLKQGSLLNNNFDPSKITDSGFIDKAIAKGENMPREMANNPHLNFEQAKKVAQYHIGYHLIDNQLESLSDEDKSQRLNDLIQINPEIKYASLASDHVPSSFKHNLLNSMTEAELTDLNHNTVKDLPAELRANFALNKYHTSLVDGGAHQETALNSLHPSEVNINDVFRSTPHSEFQPSLRYAHQDHFAKPMDEDAVSMLTENNLSHYIGKRRLHNNFDWSELPLNGPNAYEVNRMLINHGGRNGYAPLNHLADPNYTAITPQQKEILIDWAARERALHPSVRDSYFQQNPDSLLLMAKNNHKVAHSMLQSLYGRGQLPDNLIPALAQVSTEDLLAATLSGQDDLGVDVESAVAKTYGDIGNMMKKVISSGNMTDIENSIQFLNHRVNWPEEVAPGIQLTNDTMQGISASSLNVQDKLNLYKQILNFSNKRIKLDPNSEEAVASAIVENNDLSELFEIGRRMSQFSSIRIAAQQSLKEPSTLDDKSLKAAFRSRMIENNDDGHVIAKNIKEAASRENSELKSEALQVAFSLINRNAFSNYATDAEGNYLRKQIIRTAVDNLSSPNEYHKTLAQDSVRALIESNHTPADQRLQLWKALPPDAAFAPRWNSFMGSKDFINIANQQPSGGWAQKLLSQNLQQFPVELQNDVVNTLIDHNAVGPLAVTQSLRGSNEISEEAAARLYHSLPDFASKTQAIVNLADAGSSAYMASRFEKIMPAYIKDLKDVKNLETDPLYRRALRLETLNSTGDLLNEFNDRSPYANEEKKAAIRNLANTLVDEYFDIDSENPAERANVPRAQYRHMLDYASPEKHETIAKMVATQAADSVLRDVRSDLATVSEDLMESPHISADSKMFLYRSNPIMIGNSTFRQTKHDAASLSIAKEFLDSHGVDDSVFGNMINYIQPSEQNDMVKRAFRSEAFAKANPSISYRHMLQGLSPQVLSQSECDQIIKDHPKAAYLLMATGQGDVEFTDRVMENFEKDWAEDPKLFDTHSINKFLASPNCADRHVQKLVDHGIGRENGNRGDLLATLLESNRVSPEQFKAISNSWYGDTREFLAAAAECPSVDYDTLKKMRDKEVKIHGEMIKPHQDFPKSYINPTHGAKLFRETYPQALPKMKGLSSKRSKVESVEIDTQLEAAMKLIPAEGISWAQFKRENPKMENWPKVKKIFMAKNNKPVMPEDFAQAMATGADKYHITYSNWSGMQRHLDGDSPSVAPDKLGNLVMQFNTGESFDKILGEDPKLWALYQYVQRSANGFAGTEASGHPVTPHTASWIRIDTTDPESFIVEEFQSDFGAKLRDEFTKVFDAHGKTVTLNGHSYTPEEADAYCRKIENTFQSWLPAAYKGLHELAKKQGKKKIYIHGLGVRKELSGVNQGKFVKVFHDAYHKMPQEHGFSPCKYDDYPVVSDRFKGRGLDCWVKDISED